MRRRLAGLPEPSEAAINQLFTDLAQATGQKMVNLAQPVRVALTGKTASPGLYEIIHILGREEALRRINHGHRVCGTAGLVIVGINGAPALRFTELN